MGVVGIGKGSNGLSLNEGSAGGGGEEEKGKVDSSKVTCLDTRIWPVAGSRQQ